MKIDNKKYLQKVEYIDKLLEDDNRLEEYITNIENSKFEVPSNIEELIKIKIDCENRKGKESYKFFNILKVACFSLVVMITWTAMTNISFASKNSDVVAKEEVDNVEEENKISTIYGKVNEFTNTFSSLLLSPVEFKGGER